MELKGVGEWNSAHVNLKALVQMRLGCVTISCYSALIDAYHHEDSWKSICRRLRLGTHVGLWKTHLEMPSGGNMRRLARLGSGSVVYDDDDLLRRIWKVDVSNVVTDNEEL